MDKDSEYPLYSFEPVSRPDAVQHVSAIFNIQIMSNEHVTIYDSDLKSNRFIGKERVYIHFDLRKTGS